MFIRRLKRYFWKKFPYFALYSFPAVPNGVNPTPLKILYIDDCIPHPYLGAGFPRAHNILLSLEKMGHSITFYPMTLNDETWDQVYQDIPRNIEVMAHCFSRELAYFLKKRKNEYSIIFISRPHNMAIFKKMISQGLIDPRITRIIYDAEALFTPREVLKAEYEGKPFTQHEIDKMMQTETELLANSDAIFTVSNNEMNVLKAHGAKNIHVLSHSLTITPTSNQFDSRSNILFIGPLYFDNAPNTDSVIWFLNDIFPMIQQEIPNIQFIHAGISRASNIESLITDATHFLGRVDDLHSVYNNARIFIAPTRIAAGIPHKVHEAAASGIPIVCTSLIANQLEWHDECEVLVADTSEAFAKQCLRLLKDESLWNKLRTNALTRTEKDCSPDIFYNTLKKTIDDLSNTLPPL